MTSQPKNPLIPVQDVGPPWYRPFNLCEPCWKIFETGSYIGLAGKPAYDHPEFCGCTVHSPGGRRSRRDRLRRVHHQSSDSLAAALMDGCEFCNKLRLRDTFESSQEDLASFPQDVSMTCMSISMNSWGIDIDFECYTVSGAIFSFHDNLTECEYERVTDVRLPMNFLKSPWTGSTECAELATYWLHDCLENHPHCRTTVGKPWYPKRLLKLSSTHASLIHTETITPTGPYLTLSYCWGTDKFPVLTRDTLPEYEAGIPINEFLATFKDAMITTRKLGIDYIWIDCYCIMQDSMDWDIESVKMLQIYSHAILNIGAAASKNPRQAMFVNRTCDDLKARRLRCQPSFGSSEKLYRLKSDEIRDYRIEDDVGPLRNRAWVVQERLLSQRLLYFEDQQIAWRCPTLISRKESCPTVASTPTIKSATNRYVPECRPCGLTTAFQREDRGTGGDSDAITFWERTLASYTTAKLTYETDKLRGIQGIADYLALCRDDTYSNGFFLKSILKEICWRLERSPDNVNYPTRAPSWSWAAWDAPIYITSQEPVPGQMLAACVSNLLTKDGLPSTLHCVGKLIRVRWDREMLSFDNQSLRLGFFSRDGTSNIESRTVGYWYPVYLVAPGLENPVGRVVGIVLRQTNSGTFRRVGHCIVFVAVSDGDDIHAINIDSFWVTYNSERPRLIALI